MTFFKKLLKEINSISSIVVQTKPTIERQFLNEVRLRKELNSEHVWRHYYVPMAVRQIVDENGELGPKDNKRVEYLAHSLMFKDMADGKLSDYLYELESEV